MNKKKHFWVIGDTLIILKIKKERGGGLYIFWKVVPAFLNKILIGIVAQNKIKI